MAVAWKIDVIDERRQSDAEGVADKKTHKKGLQTAIESNAANSQNDGFECPHEKDGKGGYLNWVYIAYCEANRVQGPPLKSKAHQA